MLLFRLHEMWGVMLIEDNRRFGYNNPDMSRIQEILIKPFSSGVTDACGSCGHPGEDPAPLDLTPQDIDVESQVNVTFQAAWDVRTRSHHQVSVGSPVGAHSMVGNFHDRDLASKHFWIVESQVNVTFQAAWDVRCLTRFVFNLADDPQASVTPELNGFIKISWIRDISGLLYPNPHISCSLKSNIDLAFDVNILRRKI
jgi:hypothetical protein